jgi:hypothetical protein
METTKRKQGRPTIYSQKLVDTILDRIANGESLRTVCKDERMPHISTIIQWKLDNESFSAQYENARQVQAQHLFDELLEICDDTTGETQRDRLRVDTRKWYLSKVAPKIYGDKFDFTTGGEKLNTFTNEQLDAIFKRRSAGSDTSGTE